MGHREKLMGMSSSPHPHVHVGMSWYEGTAGAAGRPAADPSSVPKSGGRPVAAVLLPPGVLDRGESSSIGPTRSGHGVPVGLERSHLTGHDMTGTLSRISSPTTRPSGMVRLAPTIGSQWNVHPNSVTIRPMDSTGGESLSTSGSTWQSPKGAPRLSFTVFLATVGPLPVARMCSSLDTVIRERS